MTTVVRLADFRNSLSRRSNDAAPHSQGGQAGLWPQDRAELEGWASPGCRVVISACDMGIFAMVYQHSLTWASWGIVRQDRQVLVWDCVTLADLGRFPTMLDALAAIPIAQRPPATPSVVPFAAAQPRHAAVN